MLRRDLAVLRGESHDDSLGDYAAAFKPGGVYGVPLDESGANMDQSSGFENQAESSNNNNGNGQDAQIQPGLEDQEMPSESNNEAPLDTDAIRDSLTQVGERVD